MPLPLPPRLYCNSTLVRLGYTHLLIDCLFLAAFLALLDCFSSELTQKKIVEGVSHHISRPFFAIFQKFGFLNFNDCFFFFVVVVVNMGPHGSENFKMLLPTQLRFFLNQTFLYVSCDSPHKNYQLGFQYSIKKKKRLTFLFTGDPGSYGSEIFKKAPPPAAMILF